MSTRQSAPPAVSSVGLLGAWLGAGALVLLGGLPVLAATGILRLDQPVEPVAIPFALVFGLVFLVPGLAMWVLPLRYLAHVRGARTTWDAARIGATALGPRITGNSILASAGVGLLALAFWTAQFGRPMPLIGGVGSLDALLSIEFLTIHSFPFLVVAAAGARYGRGGIRVFAVSSLALTVALYGFASWAFGGGIGGLAAMAYLAGPNVLALVRGTSPASVRIGVITRWCIKFGVFALAAAILGDGGLEGAAAIPVGATYFTFIAAMELFRIDEVPLDASTAWGALPGGSAPVADVWAVWRGGSPERTARDQGAPG
ncbi:MAG TPA: hypothetical protein VGA37_16380 [Gemmatimonadales bacterium]